MDWLLTEILWHVDRGKNKICIILLSIYRYENNPNHPKIKTQHMSNWTHLYFNWCCCHLYLGKSVHWIYQLKPSRSLLHRICDTSNKVVVVFYWHTEGKSGGRFNNTYELLNLRALKFSPVDKIRIFQCMGMIFCVEFQRYPLKFHTKYLTHTLKDVTYKQHWKF